MDLGTVGLWTGLLDLQPMARAKEVVGELDELGYAALWVPESLGREPMANSALLLGAAQRMVIATGIASLHARSAIAMNSGWHTLTEAFPDRFLLGIGVSHQPMVEGMLGKQYGKPYTTMVEYLDAMDAAMFRGAPPSTPPQRVLAALGPKMLQLSAARALGAHPYFTPVEHTAAARAELGAGPLLAPEVTVVLETDPTVAREIARNFMKLYLRLPNYTNNLRRFGWTDDDIDGCSDRLVDAIVGWGDLDAIVARIRAHLAAGADHVCVQVLPHDRTSLPLAEWRELATVLGSI